MKKKQTWKRNKHEWIPRNNFFRFINFQASPIIFKIYCRSWTGRHRWSRTVYVCLFCVYSCLFLSICLVILHHICLFSFILVCCLFVHVCLLFIHSCLFILHLFLFVSYVRGEVATGTLGSWIGVIEESSFVAIFRFYGLCFFVLLLFVFVFFYYYYYYYFLLVFKLFFDIKTNLRIQN